MANSAITGQVSSLTGGPYVVATSGSVSIKPDEVEQFRVATTTNAVNYLQATGGVTGSPGITYLSAQGTDSNVDIYLQPKGSGGLRLAGTISAGHEAFRVVNSSADGYNTIWFGASNNGIILGNGSAGSYTNQLTIINSDAYPISFYTGAVRQFHIAHTASAANYIQVTGGPAGGTPTITMQGSDTDVGLDLATKGSDPFRFFTNSTVQQFAIAHAASAVNYLQVAGAVTADYPQIYFQGSDSNVGGYIDAKGSGSIRFRTAGPSAVEQFRIAHTASAVNYLEVTGSASPSPSISAAGTAPNININLLPKAAGAVQLINNSSTSQAAVVQNQNASSPYGVLVNFSGASPDNNTTWHIHCNDSTTSRALCYSDGDWYNHDNTYGAISDPRVKRNVTPVNSQWNDVKQIASGMINYETKWKPGHRMLGVDADAVEQISPGVVHMVRWGDEDLKAVDTMTMLQKGFKALGEALERIEALEAKAK